MIKNFYIGMTTVLSCLLLTACAQGYISGSETSPALYPSGLPPITALNITDNTQVLSGYSADDSKHCKDFKITQAQALAYFQTAGIINASDAHHTFDVSPCYAKGDLTLKFEGPAKWSINELGSATLVKRNGAEIMLFCADCLLDNVQ